MKIVRHPKENVYFQHACWIHGGVHPLLEIISMCWSSYGAFFSPQNKGFLSVKREVLGLNFSSVTEF